MMRAVKLIPKAMNSRGFTLIEVMVSIVLLAVGILAVTKLQLSFIKSNAKSNMITVGSAQAQGMIERMLELDYGNAWFNDTDNDGTNQDLNKDGVDDDGGDFGLNDIGVGAADYPNVVQDRYTFHWNVAIDHPTKGAKTINVIVQWTDESGVLRSVNYSFIKVNIANI
jgi:prepilin-type N-terminal cleavage/methylation domain-containing protein